MTSARRKWPVIALAVTAATVLSSCAEGSTRGDVGYSQDASLRGELEVLGFGAGDEVSAARVDRAIAALGDRVDVELVESDLDIEQLLSAIASGNAPDVLYANRDQIGSLAAAGAIIPLDGCLAGEAIDPSQYLDSAIEQVTLGGSIYGIPEFTTVQLTMANTVLLDAAGLTIDDVNGSDWNAVAAASEALLRASDTTISVVGVDTRLPEFFPLWAKANGADLISADGRTASLNDARAIEALDFAVGIYEAQGGFAPVKAVQDAADLFGSGNQYARSQLGSTWMEQWYASVLGDVSPDATVSFDAYRTREATPLALATGAAWAIPSGSSNAGAACRFAKVMTSVDSWIAAADARIAHRAAEGKPFAGLLTGNTEADAAIRAMVAPTGNPQWDGAVRATYLANEHTFAVPANPAGREFTAAWNDAVNRVLKGEAGARDSLDLAQDEAQAALDEAWASLDNR